MSGARNDASGDTLISGREDAIEMARRMEAALREVGLPFPVQPNPDQPDYPVVWRGVSKYIEPDEVLVGVWRAFFIIGRKSLPCWDCWYRHTTNPCLPAADKPCDHPVVWR